jgi:hypothetical protein
VNPTVPLAFDLAWTAMVLIWLTLCGIAWVSILRTSHDRQGGKFWWCVLVLVVPIFGALAWFFARPKRAEQ